MLNSYKTTFSKQIVEKVSILQLVCFGLIINLSIGLFFSYVLFPEHSDPFDFENTGVVFYLTVIIAPWLETYLVQYLIMENFYKWFKRYTPGIITCILIFSAMHFYSIEYMAKTLFSGAVYTLIYFICMKRQWNGLVWTSLVHSLNNCFGFIIAIISDIL